MIVNLYAVYDVASGVYDGPVPCQTDAVAVRNFTGLATNPESPIAKNPEDFSLVRVGRWDDSKGELILLDTKDTLITGNEAIASFNVVDFGDRGTA